MTRGWGLALCPGLLVACQPPPVATAEGRIGTMVVTLGIPGGQQARTTDEGIVIEPAEAVRRVADRAVVTFAGSMPPPLPLDHHRRLGGRTVRYGIVTASGGSGGEETRLVAEMACATGTLRMTLDMQAENIGGPDLRPAWDILSPAACRAEARGATEAAPPTVQPTSSSGLKK